MSMLRLAIEDMLHRYCRAVDRMDRPLALRVFHPDSTVQIDAAFTGSGPEFIDWVWERHRGAARHLHNITNVCVSGNGDVAASEAYVMALMRIESAGGLLVLQSHGRYLDEWVRFEDRWVIKHRRYVHEFQEIRRMESDMAPATQVPSRRDRSDASYSLTPRLHEADRREQ
jgi:SnoaL-like domain